MNIAKTIHSDSIHYAPFFCSDIPMVELDGQPFVFMKRVVEAMELEWEPQCSRLYGNRKMWSVDKVHVVAVGDCSISVNDHVVMPLVKLHGFLCTIKTSKIKDRRTKARVVRFQNECVDSLCRYWGNVFVSGDKAVVDRDCLRGTLKMSDLVVKYRNDLYRAHDDFKWVANRMDKALTQMRDVLLDLPCHTRGLI